MVKFVLYILPQLKKTNKQTEKPSPSPSETTYFVKKTKGSLLGLNTTQILGRMKMSNVY